MGNALLYAGSIALGHLGAKQSVTTRDLINAVVAGTVVQAGLAAEMMRYQSRLAATQVDTMAVGFEQVDARLGEVHAALNDANYRLELLSDLTIQGSNNIVDAIAWSTTSQVKAMALLGGGLDRICQEITKSRQVQLEILETLKNPQRTTASETFQRARSNALRLLTSDAVPFGREHLIEETTRLINGLADDVFLLPEEIIETGYYFERIAGDRRTAERLYSLAASKVDQVKQHQTFAWALTNFAESRREQGDTDGAIEAMKLANDASGSTSTSFDLARHFAAAKRDAEAGDTLFWCLSADGSLYWRAAVEPDFLESPRCCHVLQQARAMIFASVRRALIRTENWLGDYRDRCLTAAEGLALIPDEKEIDDKLSVIETELAYFGLKLPEELLAGIDVQVDKTGFPQRIGLREPEFNTIVWMKDWASTDEQYGLPDSSLRTFLGAVNTYIEDVRDTAHKLHEHGIESSRKVRMRLQELHAANVQHYRPILETLIYCSRAYRKELSELSKTWKFLRDYKNAQSIIDHAASLGLYWGYLLEIDNDYGRGWHALGTLRNDQWYDPLTIYDEHMFKNLRFPDLDPEAERDLKRGAELLGFLT